MEKTRTLNGTLAEMNELFSNSSFVSVRLFEATTKELVKFDCTLRMPDDMRIPTSNTIKAWLNADRDYREIFKRRLGGINE